MSWLKFMCTVPRLRVCLAAQCAPEEGIEQHTVPHTMAVAVTISRSTDLQRVNERVIHVLPGPLIIPKKSPTSNLHVAAHILDLSGLCRRKFCRSLNE